MVHKILLGVLLALYTVVCKISDQFLCARDSLIPWSSKELHATLTDNWVANVILYHLLFKEVQKKSVYFMQSKPTKRAKIWSIRKAANAYNVSRKTLNVQLHGRAARVDLRAHHYTLTAS